ncbi:hypothetical protein PSENEW3_00002960 [Picochlorum sp. SENEW3]|nr:hypothetical protein PSENEW3_00002960 [Picochlorum sp. SENEW3]
MASREEKRQALRERRRLHQNAVGFSAIPRRNEAETNAEYDLSDGNGPRRFNLGMWISHEMRAYRDRR